MPTPDPGRRPGPAGGNPEACPRARRGLTLVELLVVVVLFAALLALLLPAVNMAIASSRRAACGSNLRQIGLALQGYADTYSTPSLPAIAWRGGPGNVTTCNWFTSGWNGHVRSPSNGGFSWVVQILPFAEQLDTFDTIGSLSTVDGQPFASYGKFADCLVGKNTPANGSLNPTLIDDETIDILKLSWAVCPSRATNAVNERRAQCTYRANGGGSQTLSGNMLPDDGAMKHASATDGRGFALDEITDGLSMTYLVWERNDASQLAGSGFPELADRETWTFKIMMYNRTPFYCGKMLSVGLYRSPVPAADLDRPLALTPPYLAPGHWEEPRAYSGPNPNSDHPGGMFAALMADGAVRFESLKITNRVFQAQSTRNKTDLVAPGP